MVGLRHSIDNDTQSSEILLSVYLQSAIDEDIAVAKSIKALAKMGRGGRGGLGGRFRQDDIVDATCNFRPDRVVIILTNSPFLRPPDSFPHD